MNDDDAAKFLEDIGVSSARKVLDILYKASCLTWGVAGGVLFGLGPLKATAGSLRQSASTSSIISKYVSPVPSRNMTVANILVTLGIASVAVGVVCSVLKIELKNYIDNHASYAEAMRDLTPELRATFQKAAQKLLNMADQIQDTFDKEKERGINPDLMA